MNNNQKTTKTLALLLALACGLALPPSVAAQQGNSGGLFGRGGIGEDNRSEVGTTGMLNQGFDSNQGNLNNQDFGGTHGGLANQTFGAPLGGGIVILLAVGAGYAILKRKEDEK